MKQPFEKKLESLHTVRMSHTDKIHMRNALHHYMLTHPVRIHWTTKMYHSLFTRSFQPLPFSSPTFALHPALSMAALVLCVTFGTSYVAENALPGEALYAVKTRVNEPVQGALAVSDVAQVQWSTQLFERRLTEAESLAEAGRLNPQTQATLETGLQLAARDIDTHSKRLATAKDARIEDHVETSFAQAVTVHESRLEALGASSSSIDNSIQPLLAIVRTQKNKRGRGGDTTAVLAATGDVFATSIAAAPMQGSLAAGSGERERSAKKTSKQKNKERTATVARVTRERENDDGHRSANTAVGATTFSLSALAATTSASSTESIASSTATTTLMLQFESGNSGESSHSKGSSHHDDD